MSMRFKQKRAPFSKRCSFFCCAHICSLCRFIFGFCTVILFFHSICFLLSLSHAARFFGYLQLLSKFIFIQYFTFYTNKNTPFA